MRLETTWPHALTNRPRTCDQNQHRARTPCMTNLCASFDYTPDAFVSYVLTASNAQHAQIRVACPNGLLKREKIATSGIVIVVTVPCTLKRRLKQHGLWGAHLQLCWKVLWDMFAWRPTCREVSVISEHFRSFNLCRNLHWEEMRVIPACIGDV